MSGVDELPADQRAVIELVLARGRNYDEIARMLGIDRAGVRQRALAAFDVLGPPTGLAPERRALIADYLLGQLPPRIADDVRDRLAREPADRAWARVIASELADASTGPLPEIPAAAGPREESETPVRAAAEPLPRSAEESRGREPAVPGPAATNAGAGGPIPPRRSSRLGGAILLGLGALIVIAVLVIVLVNSGGNSSHSSSTSAQTPPASTTAPASTGTGTSPTPLARVVLSPPNSASKARGEAEVFAQAGAQYLAIVGVSLPANSHNFYAVWLSNSPTDSRLLGFAQPVTSTGQLEAAGKLLSTDTRYKRLLLTLETQAHPKSPGTIVLSGAFNLK